MPSYYRDPSAPAPNEQRRIGVVAFIERDGCVLLERRADFGTWGLIGGALDEDETAAEGLAREIREETGSRPSGWSCSACSPIHPASSRIRTGRCFAC